MSSSCPLVISSTSNGLKGFVKELAIQLCLIQKFLQVKIMIKILHYLPELLLIYLPQIIAPTNHSTLIFS